MKRLCIAILATTMLLGLSSCFLFSLPKSCLIDDLRAGYSDADPLFAGLAAILSARGYDVSYTSEVGFNPKNHSIILVVAPSKLFTSPEVAQIQSFLDRGGKLIMFDYIVKEQSQLYLNPLSSALKSGISFEYEVVLDSTNNVENNPFLPTTTQFESGHSLVKELQKVVFVLPSHIIVSGDAVGVVWAESTAQRAYPSFDPPIILEDPTLLAINPCCLVAASQVGRGRIVGVSSARAFEDMALLVPGFDNAKLFENIVDW